MFFIETHLPTIISDLRVLHEYRQLVKDIIIPCNAQVNRCVEQAWQSVRIEWNKRSLDEIIQIRATHNWSPTEYYDLATSIQIAKTLLHCQYARKEDAKAFIQQVYAILEKALPKRNTLAIIGEAGAGKTFFLSTIFTLVWNVCHIESYFDCKTKFPYKDLLNKRLGVINQFHLNPRQMAKYKQLFEGNMAILPRVPILITSNNRFMDQLNEMDSIEFEKRMFIHYWQPQPWLKKLYKRLHPLILPHLAKESFQNVLSVPQVVSLAEPNYDTSIYKMLQDLDSDLERDLQLVEC